MRHLDAAANRWGLCLFGDVTRAPDRCTAGRMKRTREPDLYRYCPRAGAPFNQCLAQGETVGHAFGERHSHNAVAKGEIKAVGINTGDFPRAVRFTEELRCV